MAPVFKNVGQVPTANCYHAVILLSMISKVFEKFVNNRPVYHLKKSGLFLISTMVLGLLNQQQILRQLYMIDLLHLLIGLELLQF